MIREIECKTAVDYEMLPDGGKVPVIDAYDGCQFSCPYCFQWQDPTWNQDILIKTNVSEILSQELETWDHTQALYVGSRSDPYMPIETKYGLTRRIVQSLMSHNLPCFISTKSNTPAFDRDIDLFQKYGEKLTMCIGLANVAQLLQAGDKQNDLPNMRTVHRLIEMGIQTSVFITPILPGITDVETMIAALPANVPIFLDKLRLFAPNSSTTQRFFEYLRTHYPEFQERYQVYASTGTDAYYENLKQQHQDNSRIKFLFEGIATPSIGTV